MIRFEKAGDLRGRRSAHLMTHRASGRRIVIIAREDGDTLAASSLDPPAKSPGLSALK
jgi:hypothetical protein